MAGWGERIAQLETEFPGWHIWHSNAGRWWATRTGLVLRHDDMGTGRVMTVDADDEADLRKQLTAQVSLDREIERLAVGGTTEVLRRPLAVDEGLS